MDTIDIVVVEDHLVLAEALAAMIDAEDDLRIVGRAGTAQEAIDLVRQRRPHVVLMDYQLPDGKGTDAAAEILSQQPDVAVVMLTAVATRSAMAEAVAVGCKGYVMKERGVREVVDTVRAVRRGELRFNLQEAVGSTAAPGGAPLRPLGPREVEVLRMLAAGESTASISRTLGLSPHTVRNHVRNILAKLGAHSKLEAVAIAHRHGLVGPDD